MKEAAGEANMTIITVILIALVLAAGTLIINGILTEIESNATNINEGNAGWTSSN